MFGWFNAFRENGAPTFYGDNRTPVVLDTRIFGISAVFIIPSLTFLLLLPGMKKNKMSSSLFLFNMFIGSTILVSLFHPCWHRAEATIFSPYRSFSSHRINAKILIRVGLDYLNISLCTLSDSTKNDGELTYNERFLFSEVNTMESEMRSALRRGLPYPILKTIEYLSQDGFGWGRQYRLAGHYTYFMLVLSIGSWMMSLICLALLPHLYYKYTLCTGSLIACGDMIFITQIPKRMNLRFPTQDGSVVMQFKPSICFHATCLASLLCILVGIGLWIVQSKNIYYLETIFTTRRNFDKQPVRDDLRVILSSMSSTSSSFSSSTNESFNRKKKETT